MDSDGFHIAYTNKGLCMHRNLHLSGRLAMSRRRPEFMMRERPACAQDGIGLVALLARGVENAVVQHGQVAFENLLGETVAVAVGIVAHAVEEAGDA